MFDNISVLAGKKALSVVKDEGLNLNRVKFLVGASGAAKFLVLTGIDRVLMTLLQERTERLDLVGSSIGSFRIGAFLQKDPLEAIDKLENGYINQFYTSKKPSKKVVTNESIRIMNSYIKDENLTEMLNHSFMKVSFLAVKSRYFLKSENNLIQLMNLLSAGTLNKINRKNLKYYFERALFTNTDVDFMFNDDFKLNKYKLNRSNFKKALLASGSIPLVMEGVSIDNLKGVFRDGGMIDYHLDIPFLPEDSDDLVLFPHFYEDITPGWFDKFSKRKASGINLQNTIIVAPSKKFVDSLPYQKIPDRKDFENFSDKERLKYWNEVVKKNRILGDELAEVIESGKIRDIVKEL